MKKNVVLLLLLLGLFRVYSQSDIAQLVIPRKMYIGDTIELHYSFRTSIDLFKESETADEIEIPLEKIPFMIVNDDFSIKKLVLQRNDTFFTLVFTMIPWNSGSILIPQFDLLPVLSIKSSVSLDIKTLPFEVNSLLQGKDDFNIKPENSPVLVPGTIYFIYLLLFLLIVFMFVLVKCIIVREKIAFFFSNLHLLFSYSRITKKTLRSIKKLSKKNEKFGDEEFSEILQKLLRNYLNIRFGENFSSVSTPAIIPLLENASGNFITENQGEMEEELFRLFKRTDYIRFSHKEKLNAGERLELTEIARKVVSSFEYRNMKKKTSESGDENA